MIVYVVKHQDDHFYIHKNDFFTPNKWTYPHDVFLICVDETKIIIDLSNWFTEKEIKAILK